MIISESSADGDVRVGKTQLFTSGQRVPARGKQRCDVSVRAQNMVVCRGYRTCYSWVLKSLFLSKRDF